MGAPSIGQTSSRERAAARPPRDVVRPEHGAGVLPERAGLARRSVVGRRLAHEVEPAGRTGARRVEEVAGARHGVRLRQPGAAVELAAAVVVEERGALRALREDALLEAEHEHDLRAPGTRALEVDDRDVAGAGGAGAYRRALDRAEELLGREIAAELAPALELVEQPEQRLVGTQVEPGGLGRGRSVQPMGGAEHRRGQLAHAGDRGVRRAQALERGDRPAAQLHDLRLQPLRRADAAPAQAPLDEVGVGAAEPRVRGAHEAEQLPAAAAEPRVAEQREERVPVRGLGDLQRGVERVRDAERAECRLERRADAVERRADDEDLVGSGAAAHELQDLVRDELERCARAGALEEANRALAFGRRGRDVLEERPLEVGQCGMGVVPVPGRQLLEPAAGEARQIGGGALERGEDGPSRLVLERHRDVHPAGERLEQLPLRRAQILEPVCVDGPAVPGGRDRWRAARRRSGGAGRGPRARAGRARRGSGDRARRDRRRARRDRAGRPRARRSQCRARRRTRQSGPSGRARRASPRRRRGAGRARAASPRRPAARRRSRTRSGRRRRRRSRSSRPSAPRSG